MPVDIDSIISLDPNVDELEPLRSELSQITYSINQTRKILIDKMPPGTLSLNRADACSTLPAPVLRYSGITMRSRLFWINRHLVLREFFAYLSY
jgi:hypothetical protein